MKFNLRAVLGTAIVAVAMLATGCGSLANNAAGLERNADGAARESRHERRVERGYNREYRHANRPSHIGRRGVNRHNAATQNHYLRQDDLTLRNGRFLGDGVNPATGSLERNVYNTPRPNHDAMVRDLTHRNYDGNVVGNDAMVRNQGENVRNRQQNNTPTQRTARTNTRNTALTS